MFALLLLPAAGESLAQALPAPTTFEFSVSCNTPSPSCYVAEDDAGSPAAGVTTTITVTAAYPSGTSTPTTETVLTVTVTGGATSSEATVVVDFVAVPVFELTIAENERMVTGTFEFVTVPDAVGEFDKYVDVTPTATGITAPSAVRFRITDNDSVIQILLFTLDTTRVTEGDGDGITTISVTMALPTGATARTSPNDVVYTITAGTATEDTSTAENDYEVAATTLTVTLPADATTATGSFNLTVNDDTVLETTPETISLSVSSPGFTAEPATLTIEIVDDDTQADTITLSVDPASVTEGVGTTTSTASDGVVTTTSAITVTASIPADTATAEDLPVTVALVTGTGVGTAVATDDFTVSTLSVITIPAGMLTGTGTFMLTVVDDVALEGDETLVFSGTLGTTTAVYNAIANVTLTIEDNETQADTITLSLDPASVTEGTVGTGTTATTTGGVVTTTTAVTVTASIPDNAATTEALPVTVALVTGTGAGTATQGTTEAPGDFTVSPTTTLITIPANMRTATGTFMLTVVDDEDMEGAKTVVFSGTLGTTTAVYNAIENVTLTIVDDDAPQADTITLSLDTESVTEGMGTAGTPVDGVATTVTEITVTASIPDGTATGVNLPVTVARVTGTDAGSASLHTEDDPGDFTEITDFVITIVAGERTATGTFMLTVVDDEEMEEEETLVFSGTLDAAVTGFMDIADVTLTIVDNDEGGASESMEAVLPELARVSVTSVIDVLSGRIAQVASGSLGEGSVSFAGHSSLAQALAANQQGLNDGDLSLLEALAGSSIALELDGTGTAAPSAGGQAGSSGVGVWASANYDRISSTAPVVGDWDGNQFSLFVGVDGHVSRNTLIGVAASWSKGSTEFDDDPTLETETSLLGLNPYIGWHSADGRKTAWGTVGYSSGDFEQDQQNNLKTDLKMTVLAIGGSTRFAEGSGVDFDIKGDLSTAELTTDATSSVAEVKSKAHRARVAVEAEVNKASDSGGHVMRSVALGLRYDGGDGDTGSGLELDGELGWSGPNRGVSVSGAANVLLFHTGDLKEWGLAGLIRYAPSHAKGRNLTFRAQPSYGRGESGSGQLWDQQVKDLDEDGGEPEARIVMDAGWGLAALSGRGLVTPYSGLELSEGGSRVYRLGSRIAVDSVFNIDLAANRTEDGGSPEHGIGLQLGMQW